MFLTLAAIGVGIGVAVAHSGGSKPDAVKRFCNRTPLGTRETTIDNALWKFNPVQAPDPTSWGGTGQFLFGDGVTMNFQDFVLVGSNCG